MERDRESGQEERRARGGWQGEGWLLEANNLRALEAETQASSHVHASATNPRQVQSEITGWQGLERERERHMGIRKKQREGGGGFEDSKQADTPHRFTEAAKASEEA